MSNVVINPIHWSVDQLVAYGPDAIHSLALDAAGTLNSYHIVLGRCLLAMHRSKAYVIKGCSGAVHYGTSVLGLKAEMARTMKWVAGKLENLPLLSRAGEAGEISWSKLREIVRKASPETEAFWLQVCKKTYREIVALLKVTPVGGLPGDLPDAEDHQAIATELRLSLSLLGKQTVERGLRILSLKQCRPVPLAEAVEWLFSQLVTKEGASDEELLDLAKSQEEARRDLLAERYRRDPLIQEARELAQSMNRFDETDDADESGCGDEVAGFIGASELNAGLESAVGGALFFDDENDVESPAREIAGSDFLAESKSADARWAETLETYKKACPSNENVVLLAKDWRNRRLRFNPDARHPSEAQRREILRRDGYCCSVPGCPNRLWLEVHHTVFYSHDGKTVSANLVTLCSRCHKNVHHGHLRIFGEAPDKLVFQDRNGHDLSQVYDLGVAGWLDYWHGWVGGLEDSYKHRLAREGLASTG